RELYAAEPEFAAAFDEACAALDPHLDHPLKDIVFADDPTLLNQTRYTQPALFALETALHHLLRHHGVRPDVLLGHSIGSVTAAHVAGVLSLADAATLIAARGRLMQELPPGGAMAALSLSEAETLPLLTGLEEQVGVAALNAPRSTVVSGTEDAVRDVVRQASELGARTKTLTVSHAFHSPLMEPVLAAFREVVAGLTFAAPRIPVISDLTGRAATAEELASPDHWVRHVRETVRFADGLRALAADGVSVFVELGPDAVLTSLTGDTLADAVTVPLLRRDRSEAGALPEALGALWCAGVPVDRRSWSGPEPGALAEWLPTYPFQRERYWLDVPARPAVPAGDGSRPHPLLDGAVRLADGTATVHTGRLSLDSHPWLGEHALLGTPVLPGTALLELALHAGRESGSPVVEELTLQAPLPLPEQQAVRVQVVVSGADDEGRRTLTVHSRTEGTDWTRHASGVLAPDTAAAAAPTAGSWPEPDAEPVDLTTAYETLASLGYAYGPLFQGLRAAWRRDGTWFAEVALGEGAPATEEFVLHPALLDAALHPLALEGPGASGGLRVPFSWAGVRAYGNHRAGTLRVRLTPAGPDRAALSLTDETGAPVLTAEALLVREADPAVLTPARRPARVLHRVDWVPAAVPTRAANWQPFDPADTDGAGSAPYTVLRADDGLTPFRLLEILRGRPADERHAATRLVVVTRHATVVRPGEPLTGLAQAPLWGLVRTAQTEHPGRFVLVDTDGTAASEAALGTALASGEPQLALRDGRLSVPRLAPSPVRDSGSPFRAAGRGTVLLTGATGALGGLLAEHLVVHHSVRHLLLTSRRGPDAPGASALVERLTGLGAEVVLRACDIADRTALTELLASVPPDHPLSAVVHAAGVTADATLESLTEDAFAEVMRPKSEAAQLLHELTQELGLDAFVLFSSVAGVVGNAGQGNYAAANAHLDALAQHRQALGLPAVSLAWGLWESGDGMGKALGPADLARIARTGIAPLGAAEGLDLFDAALASGQAALVPARLDLTALRGLDDLDRVPPLLRGLVQPNTPKPRAAAQGDARRRDDAVAPWVRKLAEAAAADRPRIALDLVRGTIAEILGHAPNRPVPADRGLLDLGFDSLTAVELRNRLGVETGLRLPTTVLFDQPTAAALAAHLLDELADRLPGGAATALARIAELEAACADATLGAEALGRIAARLSAVLARLAPDHGGDPADDGAATASPRLDQASDDELFQLIDGQLGAE
ncbi:SDR family NAD(P)-dependent oxidoreductase, partial [Streptomyces regalis]|uniref:SDR family NAD(P)-dependent oxidoreductase n=1 Tax=Streptomyces regalis TaxID=68262 RepID=UPI000B00D198